MAISRRHLNLSPERSVLDEVLGGVLDGVLGLPDVPHVQRPRLDPSEQLFRGARGAVRGDDGRGHDDGP